MGLSGALEPVGHFLLSRVRISTVGRMSYPTCFSPSQRHAAHSICSCSIVASHRVCSSTLSPAVSRGVRRGCGSRSAGCPVFLQSRPHRSASVILRLRSRPARVQ